jgi:di/tricarboxylate transporter
VTLASGLGGQTVYEAEEQPDAPIIVGIRNGDEIRLEPPRDENIYVGSLLALMGTAEQVQQYAKRNRLAIRSNLQSFIEVLNPARAGVAEVVIPPVSQVIGKSVTDIGMRRRYGLSLLAVSREGHAIRKGLRNLQLRAGDALVVHCKWEDLSDLAKNRNFVVVTDFPRETSRPHKVLPAVVCFALALGLTLFTDLRLSLCLMLGAVGMIITGVLTVDEGYRSVGWQSVFLLASLLPLGAAVESTNTAAWIAQQTLALAGDVPGWILQTLLAALASFFTLTMSNVGATVLLVPLAVNIALGSGADPAVYALTVALAASNSFLLPTHQVNALIMVPAGYRVADFIRAGGGLSVLFLLVLLPMLNLLY